MNTPPCPGNEEHYQAFLDDVRNRIDSTRIRIVKSANSELIALYWSLGKLISEKQEELGWGKSVVEQLASDLRKDSELRRGFSTQNL